MAGSDCAAYRNLAQRCRYSDSQLHHQRLRRCFPVAGGRAPDHNLGLKLRKGGLQSWAKEISQATALLSEMTQHAAAPDVISYTAAPWPRCGAFRS